VTDVNPNRWGEPVNRPLGRGGGQLCPKRGPKYARLNAVENMYAVWAFADRALKSSRWKHELAPARATTLLDYERDPNEAS